MYETYLTAGETDWALIIRIAGAFLVISGGLLSGISISYAMRRRFVEINELRRIISRLRGEISYGFTPLAEAFLNISDRTGGPFYDWLHALYNNLYSMENGDFFGVWEEELAALKKRTYLKKEDIDELRDMGKSLGVHDVKQQLAGIDMGLETLDYKLSLLRKELPQKKKTVLCISFTAGVFLTMILI